jgi:hypothetical protein
MAFRATRCAGEGRSGQCTRWPGAVNSVLVSLDSLISIIMLLMIDPIMPLQTHPSLETRPVVAQGQTREGKCSRV